MTDEQPPSKRTDEDCGGCLAPFLVWGSLLAIFGLTKLVVGDDQALGNKIFGWGLAAWFFGLFVALVAGKTLKETKENIVNFAYLVGAAVIAVVVVGVISLLLPSSCTSNNGPAPTELYFRK